jgi:hypothetical protein
MDLEYICSKQKEWRELYLKQQEDNKILYNKKHKDKHHNPILCECGTIIQYKYNIPLHLGTNKHHRLIKKKIEIK